ncbi:MAG: Ankyrin [Bryobacterales bacterium]|nr:Ankyrin [Bryobacterales bacterium]
MNVRALALSFAVASSLCFAAGPGNPLVTAIRSDDLPTIKRLAAKPGEVNATGDRETTPLLYASAYGSVEAIKILLAAGADANAKNAFGATPLMWCVTEPAKVRLLLDHGAAVNVKSKTGRTPLILAALHNGSDDVVDMLLAKGADTKAVDQKDGMTFLLAAAAGMNPREVRIAIERGTDVNQKDVGGFTALMNAASNGDVESVKFLLAKGADVNIVSGPGLATVKNGPITLGNFTALMLASSYGPPEIVERLLRAGAKVDPKDIRGMTALHYAVSTEAQHPEIVRLLLKAGADPAAKMLNGESSSDWAAKFSMPKVIQLLPASARGPESAKASAQDGGAAGVSARAAAERSLRLLEKVSGSFLNTGGCFSCHAQNLTALAASYAKAHGLPVDSDLQQKQLAGGKAFFASSSDQLLLRFDPPGSIDTLDYTLLHFSTADQKSDPAVDALIHNVVAEQMANGSWHSGGIARAPMQDSDIVRTALSIRAIRRFAWDGRKPDLAAHVESAHAWLRHATPTYSEEGVMQILGLKWAGETDAQLGPLAAKLAGQQRMDGGWSQNPNLPSDAYATGQTLFALAETGLAPSSPVYRRGVQFLLRTQHADGSWQVKSRAPKLQPYFQSGFPYDHDQWISMAGTAWATIALTMAVEPNKQVARIGLKD